MRFAWGRAEAADQATSDASDEQAPFELAAVELLTAHGLRAGWIATQGQRTSDWLNGHAQVPVYGLSEPGQTQAGDPPRVPSERPDTVPRDSIIWAVPPPLPPNRHLRLHRRRMLVHLELDEWEVSGQVHVRPGADATDQVLRGTREMIPLTEVQIVSRDNRAEGASVPVIIVNRSHVRRIVVDQPHASAPVPAPVDSGAVALRLAALGVTPDAAAREDVSAEVPTPPAGATDDPAAAAAPIDTADDLVRSALDVLLEVGVIDVVEFQSMRARVPAPPED